jgi:hypothetical protein
MSQAACFQPTFLGPIVRSSYAVAGGTSTTAASLVKQAFVLAILGRPEGATIDAIMRSIAGTAAQLHLQAFPVHRKSFPAPSLLARKNSLIDRLGNSLPRALKLLQECARVS